MSNGLRKFAVFTALLAAFFVFVYRGYFFLGALNQGDLTPLSPRARYSFDAFFSSWNSDFLGFPGPVEAGFFNGLLLLVLRNNTVLAQKIIFLSAIPLASIAMFIFLRHNPSSGVGTGIVSFIYGVNPLSIALFMGGGAGLLIYYSLFPFLLLFLSNFLEERRSAALSVVAFATALGFSASFNVQAPLFVLPFVVVLFIRNAAIKTNFRSRLRISLMLLASFALFSVLTLPTTTTLLASLFTFYSVSAPGTISNYYVAPISHGTLIDRVRADFAYGTFDFLNVIMYLTGIVAFFTLFVRNTRRLGLILSFLLLLSVGILFWQLGIMGSSLWMYEIFPPLFALNTIKLKMMFTQAFVLVVGLLVDEAQERHLFGLTGKRVQSDGVEIN